MYDVVIIGAGPVGLSAAIAASRRNLNYIVLEKGILCNSIYHYPVNMTFLSSANDIEIGNIPFAISSFKASRREALVYYRKVTEFFGLNIKLRAFVTDIQKNNGVFHIVLKERETIKAKTVVVATGDFDNPNKLGIPGEDLPKVTNYYREGHVYYNMNVVVVGASNSGVETALDILRSGGRVTLVHRGEWLDKHVKAWVVPDIENRIGFGEITAHFNSRLTRIDKDIVTITDKDGKNTVIKNDAVVLQIGYHPDFNLLKKAGVRIEGENSVPVHNQETLETNVQNLYIAGCLTVGAESNRIFIHNGRFHGEKIITAIEKALTK